MKKAKDLEPVYTGDSDLSAFYEAFRREAIAALIRRGFLTRQRGNRALALLARGAKKRP